MENMENMVTIGHTGISVQKNGFGALPIQRIPKEDAVKLLHRAYDAGINYYDTARAYTDSEEKLGAAKDYMEWSYRQYAVWPFFLKLSTVRFQKC